MTTTREAGYAASMSYKHIRYEKSERVARVVLNRPRYKNAQSRLMIEEMDAAFTEANADDDVRVVILKGEGEHFSSGHDLGTPEDKEDTVKRPFPKGMRGQHQRSWDLYIEPTLRWRDLPKPTIAQVHGFCIFGGWMFAAAMDLIIAADDAMFLPSLLQYFSIPWDIGVRKAKEILYQSRFVKAAEAERLGFVNMVVPRDRLEAETTALAERIAESDRFTLRMLKIAINNAQDEMGFRSAIKNSHAHHMVLSAGGMLKGRELPSRMPGVDQALRKLEKS
ncbi:MAG TPA: enoyl-CoA hydratase-related protein [Candidatus Binataceae bacterium]|nr:enoyl-CoA hydratase-related protein [Candidatus Binataceae bacterium]